MKTNFWTAAVAALALLLGGGPAMAQNDMKNETPFRQIFPQGEKNPPVNAQYFTGRSWLAPLTGNKALNVPVYNVTFEPGCRNSWHSHTGGQILLCTAGRGYYQEQGRPARELLPGDVVEIAPDVVHWHGAAPDSWFSHLAVECNPQTNRNTWLEPVDDEQYAAATAGASRPLRLSEAAARNREEWFPGLVSEMDRTDPELAELFGNFVLDEVQQYGSLDCRTRILVTMAACIARQAGGEYRKLLHAALANGVTPVEIKEVLYQAVPYAGMAAVSDFIGVTNAFLASRGVRLPLDGQNGATPETRHEKGLALQQSIFGEGVARMADGMADDEKHIARFLSANCFGDYQTRTGLDAKTRELLTFAILVSLGGCEPQVKAHIRGNANVGNDRSVLLATLTQLLPYNGYPRTLNALACLDELLPE